MLREILRGGADAVAAAGASIVGGHSIDDPEPKYGLAVTGIVDPRAVLTNARRPGRATCSCSPSRSARARSRRRSSAAWPRRSSSRAAIEVMTTLNDVAAEQARAAGAHALTDVTGFGLLGHVHELALASGLAAEIDAAAVPAIEGVLELLRRPTAGGSRRNRADADTFTTWGDVADARRRLVCDAMTSGGLLAARPARDRADSTAGLSAGSSSGEPGAINVT